jgi:hypothetical protein
MKKSIYFLAGAAGLLFTACQPAVVPAPPAALEFTANSETAKTFISGFEAESIDYASLYAEDFYMYSTSFNASKDTMSLDDMIASDAANWAGYDFELVTDLVLLPGVNGDSGEPNGSVRYYGTWRITKPATDSTEARTADCKLYESFDFNAEGKISVQMVYGDFGSTWGSLED